MTEIDQKADGARMDVRGIASDVSHENVLRIFFGARPTNDDRANLLAAINSWNAATTSNAAETAKPVGWQYRLWYEDTKQWSEWRYGRKTGALVDNDFEERRVYAAPPPLSTSSGGASTPAAEWRETDGVDPHGKRYDIERAELCGGSFTDDQIANMVFLTPNIENLTAAKDRIRWLSRKLSDRPSSGEDRAAIVEECAQLVEGFNSALSGPSATYKPGNGFSILATAIRKLSEKPE